MSSLRLISFVFVFSASVGLNAQATTEAGRQYSELLDRVFAVADDGVDILRFVGSSVEPELQIAFSVPFQGGECSARVWHLPDGATPLFSRLMDRLREVPRLRPDAIFEGLSVVQTTVTFPCEGDLAKRLLQIDALGAVRIPRQYVIAVHGVSYRLDVRNGADRLTLMRRASGLDGVHEDPLIEWMASVGRAFRDAVRR